MPAERSLAEKVSSIRRPEPRSVKRAAFILFCLFTPFAVVATIEGLRIFTSSSASFSMLLVDVYNALGFIFAGILTLICLFCALGRRSVHRNLSYLALLFGGAVACFLAAGFNELAGVGG